MNEKQAHYDWGFGLQWLAAVAIVMAAASMLAFAFVWSVGEVVENALGTTVAMFITGSTFGAIFALGGSAGSGLLLRRDHVDTGRWILNSVVAGATGMGLAFTLVFALFDMETMPEVLAGLLIGIFLGLPIGIGQWAVFRRAGILVNEWILISALAYLIAFLVGLPLGGENTALLSISVVSLLVGAISGLGIVWLRRRKTAVAV